MKILFKRNRVNLISFALIFFLFGCASDSERPEYRERTLAAIYNNAVYILKMEDIRLQHMSLMK